VPDSRHPDHARALPWTVGHGKLLSLGSSLTDVSSADAISDGFCGGFPPFTKRTLSAHRMV
jgi:hypothetical protein